MNKLKCCCSYYCNLIIYLIKCKIVFIGASKNMDKIKIGIVGMGNLGKGVMYALKQNSDLELVALFTRRQPSTVNTVYPVKVESIENISQYVGKIDVMILCGGSATDLPKQTPQIMEMFNCVDSFDTHAKIPEHFANVDKVGKSNSTLGVISVGWDPGLFSIARILFSSFATKGSDYTFWGKGVSQGHSDAIRRIEGVENAIQYTVPKDQALKAVRSGVNPELSVREKHERVCYVVAKDGADKAKIEKEIKEMPNYFSDYDTTVNFISSEELKANHSKMSHGGSVIRSSESASGNTFLTELNIKLDSNPEFTGGVLVAYARAVARMRKEGTVGAITAFDVAPKYLFPAEYEWQIAHML